MIFYQEPTATVYCGHVLKELAGLPDSSVDCVITSPPYWGLRSYKTEPQIWDSKDGCEHEWGNALELPPLRGGSKATASEKQCSNTGTVFAMQSSRPAGNFCLKCNAWRGELGLEPTIELYISHLIQIFNEVKRVLKKTGTCWVNIDDSYASGKGTCFNPGGGKGSFSGHGDRKDAGAYPLDRGNVALLKAEGLLPKSLCLIPFRFAVAMLEHGWILRNDICWNKPNPMPESVKDRFTGSWEHLYFFVKNKKYWFEQQFEQYTEPLNRWGGDFTKPTDTTSDIEGVFAVQEREGRNRRPNELGRNKRDVWEINTQPSSAYQGIRNFATFPEKLCETPILAGCPSAVCKKCGKARERVYESESEPSERAGNNTAVADAFMGRPPRGYAGEPCGSPLVIDKGYTDCDCGAGFEPGILLDPFCGSGRALAVAKKLGRKAIGIDLSRDYCKMTVSQLQAIPIPMEL